MIEVTIAVGKSHFVAQLDNRNAPATCHAALRHLPLNAQFVPARWSGPLCLVRNLAWHGLHLENEVALLSPGDIVFHPAHKDLAIAYEPTQFVEQTRSVYVTRLGRVTAGLLELGRICATLWEVGEIRCTWSRTV